MGFHIIIPARYASTRLPGKPLLDIAGKTMLQRVYEAGLSSKPISCTIATDDLRIKSAVEGFGGRVCMTASTHPSGTDRLAETIEILGLEDSALVVNLQGDEPLIPPSILTQVASLLEGCPEAVMATLSTLITSIEDLMDPNVVKVIRNANGLAQYFSRSPIPWNRDHFAENPDTLPKNPIYQRHLGIYAYRASFLRRYSQLASCEWESVESLEQLRVLWHGEQIVIAEAAEIPGHGIDTEADLQRMRRLFS